MRWIKNKVFWLVLLPLNLKIEIGFIRRIPSHKSFMNTWSQFMKSDMRMFRNETTEKNSLGYNKILSVIQFWFLIFHSICLDNEIKHILTMKRRWDLVILKMLCCNNPNFLSKDPEETWMQERRFHQKFIFIWSRFNFTY